MGKYGQIAFESGLGFVSQLGTSLINNALSQRNAKEQRAWQEKIMDKQNAYNSPIQDKIRKMAAGVNPYAGELNSVPSASAGTGATAQTIPMQDPLASAFTLAQIRNMNAQTGKTETETEKVLREIANLEQLYQKGIIQKDEMEFRLNKLKEAWKDNSQYDADLEKTQSDTDLNRAKENQTLSETALNNAQKVLTDAQAEYQRVLSSNADAESKARVKATLAQASASYASAEASKALAEKYHTEIVNIDQQTWNMMNEEQRKAALHPYDVQLKKIAVEQGYTESDILSLQQQWQEFISRKDSEGDFTLSSVFAKFLLDNVFVSISPGKGKQSTK